MKNYYIVQAVGISLLLVFGIRMFGLLSFLNGSLWLSCLFSGLLVCMWGFWLEESQLVPVNEYQAYQKKVKMGACKNAICLCAVVLIFIIVSCI